MREATLRIQAGRDAALAAKAAILPESEREIQRTSVSVITEEKWLMLSITAEDTTSLRAAINSYMRWIKVAMDTTKMTKQ